MIDTDPEKTGERWIIDMAKKGDGSLLGEFFRSRRAEEAPLSRELLDFLAGVFWGEIKLRRRRKRLFLHEYWRPEAVVWTHVRMLMGKRRDKAERYRLIRDYCKAFGTTVEAYERYAKHA